LSTDIVKVCAWCPADTNSSDNLTVDFDREPAAQH
jgi:hypothetical protein